MNEKQKLVRNIIEAGFFTESQITKICGWLGFNDTAFRDKSSKDKLKDYLIDDQALKGDVNGKDKEV